jgi:UDP-N-acetylglucosamine diphosphorylase/glucosamine-1-phosphate N-acetyltransferase
MQILPEWFGIFNENPILTKENRMNTSNGQIRNNRLGVIILAAGKGTRMKSEKAKVLHCVHGRPMLSFSIEIARNALAEKIIIVVGHQADVVKANFRDEDLIFVEQREQLGTGHAVMQARGPLEDFSGDILILCGDVPLLSAETVSHLLESHAREQSVVTVLTAMLDDPFGYGRIVKTSGGDVLKIVEEKDASEEEKKIKEFNSGIYCVESSFLLQAVGEIKDDNAQKEYYLTDIIEIACRRNLPVRAVKVENVQEILGINTPEDLRRAEDHMAGISRGKEP